MATPLPALPRRDLPDRGVAARARLAAVGDRVRPTVQAGARVLELAGPLAAVIPQGVPRGSVVTVSGVSGAGATSLALAFAAAATAVGEWAAFVEPDTTLGGIAAADAGIALDRFALVRDVSTAQMASVTAALLDGITCVVARSPGGWRLGDARRLRARARERSAVLVVQGEWPEAATLRLHAEASAWSGLALGDGLLSSRTVRVRTEGRGVASRIRHDDVALAG